MSWTSMHFAVGMGCTGAAALLGCTILGRGWRWIPAAMTAGGVWSLTPDLPRLWREDFPNLPLASILGQRTLEARLHEWGDVFFFHHWIDHHRGEMGGALAGLFLILLMYNVSIGLLMWLERRARHSEERWASKGARLPRATHIPVITQDSDDGPVVVHRIRSSHLSRTG